MIRAIDREPTLGEVQAALDTSVQRIKAWETGLREAYGLDSAFLQQQLTPIDPVERGRLRLSPQAPGITTTIAGIELELTVVQSNEGPPYSIVFSEDEYRSSLCLGYRDYSFSNLMNIGYSGLPSGNEEAEVDIDEQERIILANHDIRNINSHMTFRYNNQGLAEWDFRARRFRNPHSVVLKSRKNPITPLNHIVETLERTLPQAS